MIQILLAEMDLYLLQQVDWLFVAWGEAGAPTVAEPHKFGPPGTLNETLRHFIYGWLQESENNTKIMSLLPSTRL